MYYSERCFFKKKKKKRTGGQCLNPGLADPGAAIIPHLYSDTRKTTDTFTVSLGVYSKFCSTQCFWYPFQI